MAETYRLKHIQARAIVNALKKRRLVRVPAEPRDALDLRHAKIAYDLLLNIKPVYPEPSKEVTAFFDSAIYACEKAVTTHFADNCRILAIACDMVYRLKGNVDEDRREGRWGSRRLDIRCTELGQMIPEEEDDHLEDFLLAWKQINSFFSHLVNRGYHGGLSEAFLEIGRGLEEPIKEGSVMDCRVWIAAEWMINCGDLMFKLINNLEEVTDDTSDDSCDELRPGPLYGKELPPFTLDRWEFWKKRFAELGANPALDDATKKHVATALNLMREPSGWEKRTESLERAIKQRLEIGATKRRSTVLDAAKALYSGIRLGLSKLGRRIWSVT
ncbi:unnamed protein product [Clonostachys rosea]|uniref:Uncharacterized protein n=1 Tax=Bionectria ochroleuca TaxID=29856 RepID=A0ABY6U7N0_BIOOC|nr:unnamed protein product [Clonostachys rosea]